MKFKTTWILLAAFTVIALFYFLVEKRQQAAKEEERIIARKLLPYGPKDVQWLVLINPRGERIEMERRGDDWMITYPTITPGSNSTIDVLLRQTVPGFRLKELAGAIDPAGYGLAEPFATLIIFSSARSQPDTIFVGDKTPTGSSSYVRLGGSPNIIVAHEMTRNVMQKNLYHLRDKNFLHLRAEAINKITITGGTKRVSLERTAYHWWREKPRHRVHNAVVEGNLNKITKALVYEFAREDIDSLSSFGFGEPKREIVLYTAADTVTIRFGARKGNRIYAVRTGEDRVLLLDRKVEGLFDILENGMRAMNLTFYYVGALHTIHYETADTSAVFEASGGRWNMAGAPSAPINSHEINRFLRKLESIKFTKITKEPFPEGGGFFDGADLQLTLRDPAGEIVDRMAISVIDDSHEIGASNSANAQGRLEAGTLASLHRIFTAIGSGP